MSKHTPGPWDVEGPETDPLHRCICTIANGYAVVATDANPDQYDEGADARLIAVAPELLEELEDRYHDTKCGCGHPACRRCQADARTLAVIIKAKGQQE